MDQGSSLLVNIILSQACWDIIHLKEGMFVWFFLSLCQSKLVGSSLLLLLFTIKLTKLHPSTKIIPPPVIYHHSTNCSLFPATYADPLLFYLSLSAILFGIRCHQNLQLLRYPGLKHLKWPGLLVGLKCQMRSRASFGQKLRSCVSLRSLPSSKLEIAKIQMYTSEWNLSMPKM